MSVESGGDVLYSAPDAEQIAAPDLLDVGFAVAALDEFAGDVAAFGGVVPASNAAAAVEVGADADVVDAGDLDDVLDVIYVVADVGRRVALVELVARFLQLLPVGFALLVG